MTEILTKTPTSLHTILFTDCDPYGHLNNSKFIDYCLNAREEHLEKFYDINVYQESKKSNSGWVVYSNQITYLAPAFYREQVEISSKIIKTGPKGITVEFIMKSPNSTKAKCILWTTFVHYDMLTGKSSLISDYWNALVVKVIDPLSCESFEERLRQIKNGQF